MKVDCINYINTNFNGLNYSKVVSKDRGYVMDELEQLKEISKNYDITLKSDIVNSFVTYRVIKVTVSPLKSTLNFFRKLFPPKVSLNFHTDYSPYPEAENEYLMDVVKSAIKYLNS